MTTKPDPNDSASNPVRDAAEQDVEGHRLPLAAAVDALARPRRREEPRNGAVELPPLTKPFPRLR